MRQADSTIKGYIYQFNKSILEILMSSGTDIITLEGIIEDIDIKSVSSYTTIQCKYHEDKIYTISDVTVPILEMLCTFSEDCTLGRNVNYILFAHYKDNVQSISKEDFVDHLNTTQSKEILVKYFPYIYKIIDQDILKLTNKPKKSEADKQKIQDYFKTSRTLLPMQVDLNKFWTMFTYISAVQFDILKQQVINELKKITDDITATELFYPNAFSRVAELSSKSSPVDRSITKEKFLKWLSSNKSILVTRWAIEALETKEILKLKRNHLLSLFSGNAELRAFIFTSQFIKDNTNEIITFIEQYIGKYFKKPKLQKPPIFILDCQNQQIYRDVIISLHRYQIYVNTGMVAGVFLDDSFVSNTDCPSDYKCKITYKDSINAETLVKCNVNQLYWIGTGPIQLRSDHFTCELLEIKKIKTLRYLIGLDKVLEEI